jgi:hypothetical protein
MSTRDGFSCAKLPPGLLAIASPRTIPANKNLTA